MSQLLARLGLAAALTISAAAGVRPRLPPRR